MSDFERELEAILRAAAIRLVLVGGLGLAIVAVLVGLDFIWRLSGS